jgi:hypothetical protein
MTYWDAAIETVNRGWNTGSLCAQTVQRGETHCLLGAIGYARWGSQFDRWAAKSTPKAYAKLDEDPVTMAMIDKVLTVLNEQYPCRFWGNSQFVYLFNDNHTKAEVIAVLEKAAAEGDVDA